MHSQGCDIHLRSPPQRAAAIIPRSPRACRTVLVVLAADAAAGRLDAGAHGRPSALRLCSWAPCAAPG
jgi:hypothetical protein